MFTRFHTSEYESYTIIIYIVYIGLLPVAYAIETMSNGTSACSDVLFSRLKFDTQNELCVRCVYTPS